MIPALPQALQSALARRQESELAHLRRWVEMESPTTAKGAVDGLGQAVAGAFAELGAESIRHADRRHGDHLELHLPRSAAAESAAGALDAGGGAGLPPPPASLLVLGHLDTVYPLGTLERMRFAIEDGRVRGPGVLDMKGGVILLHAALHALRDMGLGPRRPVTLLLVSDEEIGSPGSRPLTEARARHAAAVLVLEPGNGPSGKLKTARKGIGRFTVAARGRAAHAGVDFERGASAVVEISRQVLGVTALTDKKRGVTVNAGVVRGGTRSNVVAAEAQVELDVRAWRYADLQRLERVIARLKAHDRRVTLTTEGELNRPPMERTPEIAALFRHARRLARLLGLTLGESASGGGSDGNFTAALGVPTLDGLGAVGEHAHSPEEYMRLDAFVPRAGLLALLLLTL